MICDGRSCHASDNMKQICDNTITSIYITVFDTLLKVGVSKRERLRKRWLEQGADYGVEIAVIPNGMLAREIESRISEVLEVSKGVRFSRKVNNLRFLETRDAKAAEDIISKVQKKVAMICKWLSEEYGASYTANEIELVDLSSQYSLKSNKNMIRLDIPNVDTIAGEFRGMKGSIFCIGNNDSEYVLDIRDIRGFHSEYRKSSGHQIVLKNQKSIADYFG
jgi:hypothetical protein